MSPIVRMLFGSYIYGTNLPTSDHDYKVVFLPTAKDIILNKTRDAYNESTKVDQRAKNTSEDVETEFFSFKKYMNLLIEGQTVALDMLFTPESFYLEEPHPVWKKIKENKHKFLHSGVSSFVGYCRQQANKYGIKGSRVASARAAVTLFTNLQEKYGAHAKLKDHWDFIVETMSKEEHVEFLDDFMRGNPEFKVRMLSVCNRKVQEHITVKEALKIYKHIFDEYGQRALLAETNEGIDWKALMHAVRVTEEAKELLSTGHITFPRPEKDVLLQIRQGLMPYKDVADLIERGMQELEAIQENSVLPKEIDREFFEKFVYDTYLETILWSV